MTAVVRLIAQPVPVIRVIQQAGPVIKLPASTPPATVKVLAEGTQGPRGLAGPEFDIFSLPLAPAN